MSRSMLIAGNWKMNLGLDDARSLAQDIADQARPSAGVEVAVFPPFPWLLSVREAVGASGVQVGAQNCYARPSGAFTGEVSPAMLSGLCDSVIIGHSERRHVFGESDELIAEKSVAVVSENLQLVLCVGETLEERQRGAAEDVVNRQLNSAITALTAVGTLEALTIAYEPVWAIGTGVAATAGDAQEMCAAIRAWLRQSVSSDAAGSTRVLYGGSVTADNAHELLGQEDIDGALVGGASLKSASFLAIISAANAVARG